MRIIKLIKLIKPFLVLMLLVAVLAGCEKDELSTTGTLKITYADKPADLYIRISPAENSQISIVDDLKASGSGATQLDLNYGNYILTSSSSNYYPKVAFQIRAGKTTTISFDSGRKPSVYY